MDQNCLRLLWICQYCSDCLKSHSLQSPSQWPHWPPQNRGWVRIRSWRIVLLSSSHVWQPKWLRYCLKTAQIFICMSSKTKVKKFTILFYHYSVIRNYSFLLEKTSSIKKRILGCWSLNGFTNALLFITCWNTWKKQVTGCF